MTDDISRLPTISLISDSPLATNVLIRCLVAGPLARHVEASRQISDRLMGVKDKRESVMVTPTTDN
jgi:hypothetical protein